MGLNLAPRHLVVDINGKIDCIYAIVDPILIRELAAMLVGVGRDYRTP